MLCSLVVNAVSSQCYFIINKKIYHVDANCVNLDNQKPSDLESQDLHCFQKKVYNVEVVVRTMHVLGQIWFCFV